MGLGKIAISILVIMATVAGCASSSRFTASKRGERVPGKGLATQGYASYYADDFHGRKTANGETYDMHGISAAHRTLPFNTKVRVTNTTNGKSVVVRINDRGPFKDDRIIDLSLGAARKIDMIGPGTVWVELEILEMGPK
jgi:rare lipoprotein A